MLTEEAVRAAIEGAIDRVAVATLERDADFYDVGLDSLDHAQILMALEELHGLRIPEDDVDACRSIAAIIDYARGAAA
ncbi:MAG: acyl carrier protein [Alphaproteobacteria bacterium]|nr:acyl carrier protein [Alphaproteobacteria bacterium]